MDRHEAHRRVCGNLRFFLSRLRGLPVCQSADLEGGRGFCLSTRSESASDNWAFLPTPPQDPGTVEAALRFFEARSLPFVWPVLQEDDRGSALQRAGLREAGRLLTMACPARDAAEGCSRRPAMPLTFHPVRSRDGALRWADAAWLGFDGKEPTAPAAFRELADAMRGDPSLLPLTARLGDSEAEDAGTCLLTLSGAEMGVYYFAVLPRHRRHGVAAAMMATAGRVALERGCSRIVLQATPAGVPFYRSAGFADLREMPLFSTSDDVF